MKRKNEAGQALVFAAVGLVVLMGFAGLGIDMGMLRYQKRLQQTAADSAAVAGANNLGKGGVTTGAKNASGGNGFTDGTNNVTVTINNPPTSGPHSGDGNYVEALVTAVQPTYFMKILGFNSQTLTARAVATNVSGASTGGGCLYTLGPPAKGIGVVAAGSAVLNATKCGIADNGDYDPTGGALTVNAGTFGVAGTCSGSGCGKGAVTCAQTPNSCPTYGTPAVADPLASLTPPSQPGASASCPAKGACDVTTPSNATTTLQPGTYNSITIGKNSTVILNSGIYYFNGSGGVQFNGDGSVTSGAGGVMFYFNGTATINAVGGGNKTDDVNLSPLSSGTYAGILFYQDPSDTSNPTLGGNDGSIFGGIAYFPSADLTYFGNANSTAGIIIAKSFALSGNPTVNLQGSAGLPPGVNIISNATLVE
jgi:hypothetical protein